MTTARANPLVEADLLKRNGCQLRALIDAAGANGATNRYACRLESAADELYEKLSCSDDLATIEFALREVATWLERTTIGVEANRCLRLDVDVVHSLEATHISLARTAKAIECWPNGRHGPPTDIPFGGLLNHPSTGNFPLGLSVPFGVPHHGSFPFGGKAVDHRARFGVRSTVPAAPAIHSNFSGGLIGVHRSGLHGAPTLGIAPYPPSHVRSFAHELEPHAPFGIAPNRGPGNGEIGRAIISAVLSELMRH